MVAQSGTTLDGFTLTTFERNPSINDAGKVAFIGRVPGGGGIFNEGVFVGDGLPGGLQLISTSDLGPNRDFQTVWINNRNEIAATLISTTAPRTGSVRRYYYEGGSWKYAIVAKGADIVSGQPPNGNCQPIYPFLNIFPNVSMNDDGLVAFSGQTSSGRNCLGEVALPFVLLTTKTDLQEPVGGTLSLSMPQAFAPVIDSNGRVVVRAGTQPNSPILLYPANFSGPPQAIATESMGFTRIGNSPGMGDNGSVVAFYADIDVTINVVKARELTEANGDVVPLPVTPGRGVFVSVNLPGANKRYIIRVAGEVRNGYPDPGERWAKISPPDPNRPGQEFEDRGQDYNYDGFYNNPNYDWEIESFLPDTRVAVSGLQSFADAAKGSFVTVVYLANDTAGNRGVFSGRVNIFSNSPELGGSRIGVEAPVLVTRIGERINDLFGSVGDLAIYDPINKAGQITFWARNANFTEAIFQANPDFRTVVRVPRQARFDGDSPIVEYIVAPDSQITVANLAPGCANIRRTFRTESRVPNTLRQIIIHATDGFERGDIVDTLGKNRPECLADCDECVSIHYHISREGRVTQVVQEKDVAHHAGVANSRTIGIELTDNKGHRANES